MQPNSNTFGAQFCNMGQKSGETVEEYGAELMLTDIKKQGEKIFLGDFWMDW
jgi:hypothetical protein